MIERTEDQVEELHEDPEEGPKSEPKPCVLKPVCDSGSDIDCCRIHNAPSNTEDGEEGQQVEERNVERDLKRYLGFEEPVDESRCLIGNRGIIARGESTSFRDSRGRRDREEGLTGHGAEVVDNGSGKDCGMRMLVIGSRNK